MEHWGSAPFRRLLNYMEEADRLVALSIEGIRKIVAMVPLAEALHSLNRDFMDRAESEESQQGLSVTREKAAFAQNEIDNAFPLLHAHTLVGIWGAFEASIEDLAVLILLNDPIARNRDPISKVRISIAEFETLDSDERMRVIIQELQRTLRAEQRLGVNAFEIILQTVGLDGAIDENVSKDIFEYQQIRHAIVHRGLLADRHLTERCPWLNLHPGERIKIDHKHYRRLTKSVTSYSVLVIERLKSKYPLRQNS